MRSRMKKGCRYAVTALAALLVLLLAGCALAEERHTVTVNCGGEGLVGNTRRGKQSVITLAPEETVRSEDGREWTLAELRQLPDFQLGGAAMRFTVKTVNGLELKYAIHQTSTFAE